MKRTLIIIAVVLVAAAAAALAGSGYLLNTGHGRAVLAARAAKALGDGLGGTATIGALEPGLPGRLILRDVTASGPDGVWLTLDRIDVTWSPLAALGGRIRIAEATIDGARLLAPPPAQPDEDEKPAARTTGPLPDIEVRAFRVRDFTLGEAVLGREATLSADGSMMMGGDRVAAQFKATSLDGRDAADARIDIDFSRARRTGVPLSAFDVALTARSSEDGVAATLLALEGPLYLEASTAETGGSPALALTGDFGSFGRVEATAVTNPADTGAVAVDLSVGLGPALGDIAAAMGEIVTARMVIAPPAKDGEEGRADIASIETAAGVATGGARWRTRRGRVLNVEADLAATLSEGYFDDLRREVGPVITVSARLSPKGEDYALAASVSGERAGLSLADAVTDLKNRLTGALTLTIRPSTDESKPPALKDGATLAANAAYDGARSLDLSDIRLDLGGRRVASGAAAYSLQDRTVSADLDIALEPASLAALAPGAAAEGPVSARLAIRGAADDFTASLEGALPRIVAGEAVVPAAAFTANLQGLPSRPEGVIDGRALHTDGRLSARLAAEGESAVSLRALSYSGDGFSLTGEGLLDPSSPRLAIDLAYRGAEGATPMPGVVVAGGLTAKGVISAGAEPSDLAIDAPRITVGGARIEGLAIRAAGPADALSIDLRATEIASLEGSSARNLSARAIVTVDGPPSLLAEAFSVDYDGTSVRLLEPARLRFGETIVAEAIRLAIGEGALTFEGTHAPDRIVARIEAREAPLLGTGTGALVSLAADLDTSREARASGTFSVRSDEAALEDRALDGRFDWTGDRLAIRSAPKGLPATIDVALPLALRRTSEGLVVSTEGPVSGSARYKGPVSALADFAPEFLESLEGDLTADAAFGGTLAAPTVEGRLSFSNGAYTELSSGLSLVGINAEANGRLAGETLEARFAGGARGPGQKTETIRLEGGVEGGLDAPRLNAKLSLDGAEVGTDLAPTIRASGDVTLAGLLDALEASGEIRLAEVAVEIAPPKTPGITPIEVVGVGATTPGAPPSNLRPAAANAPLKLDIAVKADNRIFVRGLGLDSEWRADLRAISKDADMLAVGDITLRRGALDFAGRRFTITTGELVFDRLSPNNPGLNIRAEYQTEDDVTAAIVIGGRAATPSVELTSTPSLPQEDIMALVLFGKPASELSAIESLQMAQALAQLAGLSPFGGGGGGLAGSARDAVGLDLLNVDLDTETGASALTVGKYLADGLFVSATQDVKGENGSVRVEYELTGNISVETQLRQNGDQQVSANWKTDF